MKRVPFPRTAFYTGLALFLGLALLFQWVDWDRQIAAYYWNQGINPWPGQHWRWAELLYGYGQWPANLVGGLGWLAFGLSFSDPTKRAWRGPGLYLGLVLLLGPGLLTNTFFKGLAGRPRPEDVTEFGGLWDFHRPFHYGTPGQGRAFISGHASSAWFFLTTYFLVPPRRRWLTLGAVLIFGGLMSWARVSQGAHFLSDTLLAGALTFTVAAALSPLIHWQPRAALLRRKDFRLAVAGAIVGWLLIGNVAYEEHHFVMPAPSVPLPDHLPPPMRILEAPAKNPPDDVAVDVELQAGDLVVRFDRPLTPTVSALAMDEIFQGQALPGAKENLTAGPLPTGHLFTVTPNTLGLRFAQRVRGLWLQHEGQATLSLPAQLPVDARLDVADGAVVLGPFPAGRRVLIARLPEGQVPPQDFHPYGNKGWLRDGEVPLIALDIKAGQVRFVGE